MEEDAAEKKEETKIKEEKKEKKETITKTITITKRDRKGKIIIHEYSIIHSGWSLA